MSRLSQQVGVGLVEVLVAVLLLSVAVLGFSALQVRAISATDESLVRTQALSTIRGLSENMRANYLQIETYQTAINAADSNTVADNSCQELTNTCDSEEIAIKEANSTVAKLNEYDISIRIKNCPSNEGTSEFSKIKCIIAAWGDTQPVMDASTNACANENGIYNNGSTCVIVEAY